MGVLPWKGSNLFIGQERAPGSILACKQLVSRGLCRDKGIRNRAAQELSAVPSEVLLLKAVVQIRES